MQHCISFKNFCTSNLNSTMRLEKRVRPLFHSTTDPERWARCTSVLRTQGGCVLRGKVSFLAVVSNTEAELIGHYGCAYDTVHGCAVDNVTARYKHFCGKENLTQFVTWLLISFTSPLVTLGSLTCLVNHRSIAVSSLGYSCEQDANRETHMHDGEYFKGMVTCSMLFAKQGQTWQIVAT